MNSTYPIRLMVTEDLGLKIEQLMKVFESDKAGLIRGLLWRSVEEVIADINNLKSEREWEIMLRGKNKELLVRREVNNGK